MADIAEVTYDRAVFAFRIQDAVITVDDQARYINANSAAASIYGVPPEQLIGRPISDFTEPGFDLEKAWKAFLPDSMMAIVNCVES